MSCEDCPSELQDLMDDDDIAEIVREHVMPMVKMETFVVTVEVTAYPDMTSIEALLKQYKHVKDVPGLDKTIDSIYDEIVDTAEAMGQLEQRFIRDVIEIPTNSGSPSQTNIYCDGMPMNIDIDIVEDGDLWNEEDE